MDLAEKAEQIPLMDRIFRGAKQVLVYLGSGGREDEMGMQHLKRITQSQETKASLRRIQGMSLRCLISPGFGDSGLFKNACSTLMSYCSVENPK